MYHSDPLTKIKEPSNNVLKPLLYADIFDFPLTFDEIYKFLEFETDTQSVKTMLDEAISRQEIICKDGYYSLASKPDLVTTRKERFEMAQTLWPVALHYGGWIAALPFVRMVAITGSLAVNNPRDSVDDIDYFIITEPNRLWLCRALVIAMVRYAHRRGVHLCPNYLLTENATRFSEHNLYTARELSQMVPIYGETYYVTIRRENAWSSEYLPQAKELNVDKIDDALPLFRRLLKRAGEFILGSFIGSWAEQWLQKKQISKHMKLAEQYGALDKVTFTADECKGHYDGHGQKTLNAYQKRVTEHKIDQNGVTS